jgi:endonuclease/exonuclease/phosphatase family metal-dependent hydrolase
MKKIIIYSRIQILLLLIFSISLSFGQSSFRMVTYNLLQYDGTERNGYLKTVIDAIDPDLIVVQEIESQVAVDSFMISVLDNEFRTIPFHDGYTTDNHIFYNPFMMEILSATYIPTDLRDIAEYKLRFPRTNDTLTVYSAHLKAGNPDFDPYDQDLQRLAEIAILRDEHLNTFPQGTKFTVCGDLNLYKSSEPAYQKLLAEEPGNYGQSFDPIDRSGNWHNSSAFSDIHSQSTRTIDLGDGGSTGGMDDRFDFILVSASLMEKVVPESYKSFGNDGDHFNLAINSPTNNAVSEEVANALYAASDHLPVVADIDFSLMSPISDQVLTLPMNFKLEQNYPNPFNPTTIINYELRITNDVDLSIYSITGKKVATLISEKNTPGRYTIEWEAQDLSSGVYFYILTVGTQHLTKKMIRLK